MTTARETITKLTTLQAQTIDGRDMTTALRNIEAAVVEMTDAELLDMVEAFKRFPQFRIIGAELHIQADRRGLDHGLPQEW